jgi:hypothetical protein
LFFFVFFFFFFFFFLLTVKHLFLYLDTIDTQNTTVAKNQNPRRGRMPIETCRRRWNSKDRI